MYFCCIVVLCIICFFFFFKQKTAYEMRISDWSSDVCSSDLVHGEAREMVLGDREEMVADPGQRQVGENLLVLAEPFHVERQLGRPEQVEIGRASCRERVCQYV